MKLERKTIFLYPEANELTPTLYEETSKLITRIRTVVNISNELIKGILCGGSFSSVKCKPTVTMKCVGDNLESYSDYSNVRICIAKYNGIDYTSNYVNIIDAVKNDRTDISHLVALYIFSGHHPMKFYKDSDNQFDAIVETDLDHLEHLLTAIMLDISLYHYFSLSNDLKFRKHFNNIKFHYIKNKFSPECIKRVYGENIESTQSIYLPFSMEKVLELSRRTKQSTKKKSVDELIRKYGVFLIESVSEKIIIDEQGYADEKLIKEKRYYSLLLDYIRNIRMNNVSISDGIILIITSDDSTKKVPSVVLKYKLEETDIESWLKFLKTNTYEYDIILIKEEE